MVGDRCDLVRDRARVDAAVRLVGVDRDGVAVSQLERCGGFPGVGEPVDVGQQVGAAGGAQFGEHPTPTDGLQLIRVTDQHQPPPVGVGEGDQPGEVGGADHAGLVDDDRACRLATGRRGVGDG